MQDSKSSFCCTECFVSCLVSSVLVFCILFHGSYKTFKLGFFFLFLGLDVIALIQE